MWYFVPEHGSFGFLVLTYHNDSRILSVTPRVENTENIHIEVEDITETMAFYHGCGTIHTGIFENFLLQATTEAIHLYDLPPTSMVGPTQSWMLGPQSKITFVVCGNRFIIACAFANQSHYLIALQLQSGNFVEVGRKRYQDEISCATIPTDPPNIIIIGTYSTGNASSVNPSIEVLSLDTATLFSRLCIAVPKAPESARDSPPNSLALLCDRGVPTIFAGMRDGSLQQFELEISPSGMKLNLTHHRVLGSSPVSLFLVPLRNSEARNESDHLNGLIAVSDRAWLIQFNKSVENIVTCSTLAIESVCIFYSCYLLNTGSSCCTF